MASTSRNHPINSTDFYLLSAEEIRYIRKIKKRQYLLFGIIGIVIITMAGAATLAFSGGKTFISALIGFLMFSALGWAFFIIAVYQVLRTPEGGRYGTIVSCFTTTETTGSGDDQTTSTYYHFTVRFDDTGKVYDDFIGTMFGKTFRTGSRVLVVKNKTSNFDVFSADELIDAGVYTPPLMPPEETPEEKARELGGISADIDSLLFYPLSDADIHSIRSLKKRQVKTLIIIAAVFSLFPLGFAVMSVLISDDFLITLFIMLAIILVIVVALAAFFSKLLNEDPSKKYTSRHVIIRGKRTESVMHSSGSSQQTYYYTLETTDTHEILTDVKADPSGVYNTTNNTEMILAKDNNGKYKLFRI